MSNEIRQSTVVRNIRIKHKKSCENKPNYVMYVFDCGEGQEFLRWGGKVFQRWKSRVAESFWPHCEQMSGRWRKFKSRAEEVGLFMWKRFVRYRRLLMAPCIPKRILYEILCVMVSQWSCRWTGMMWFVWADQILFPSLFISLMA